MSVLVSHARHLWSLVSEAPRSARVSVGQRTEWAGSQPVFVPVGAAPTQSIVASVLWTELLKV